MDMDGIGTLYVFVLAGIAGYMMIARVPSVLHLSLLSGANFVHGVVLCGAMLALARADGDVERAIGFVGVALAAGNVVGGYLVTDRLVTLFERRASRRAATSGGRSGGPAAAADVARGAGTGPAARRTAAEAASGRTRGATPDERS